MVCDRTNDDHLAAARSIVRAWREMGRPVIAAYIQGSTARNGYVARGSDLDVRIVVAGDADPAWLMEQPYGSSVIEAAPIALAALQDEDRVLADPALPLAIAEAVILDDPDGVLQALRNRIAPRLCDPTYIRRRAAACVTQANTAFDRADAAIADGNLVSARQAFSSGVWYTIGLVGVATCQSPTTRRVFVMLQQAAARWGRPDITALAFDLLGAAAFTEAEARRLTDVCSPLGPRYHEGAMAMIDAGEVRESAWAIFFGALWGAHDGKRLDPQRQDVIFASLGFDTLDALRHRLMLARPLAAALHGIANESV